MEWYPNRPQGPTVVCIGFFDGVHLGHQTLLRVARQQAAREGGQSLVLTFDRHPQEVLRGEKARRYLTPLEEKRLWLLHWGADALAVQPFTEEFSRLTPQEFVSQVLLAQCQARGVVVGADFRFGHRRSGTVEHLRQGGLRVTVVPPVSDGTHRISSTRIRRALLEGQVRQAARWLGRPYLLEGKVRPGSGLGRRLGFPTLNLTPSEEKLLPAFGVYIGLAMWEEGQAWGALNVGLRPTLGRDRSPQVEIHLLDFQGSLEGAWLRIFLMEHLRPERAFPSLEALREAIAADVERTRQWVAAEGERWLRRLEGMGW